MNYVGGRARKPELSLRKRDFVTLLCKSRTLQRAVEHVYIPPWGGGGVIPYKGLMGTCGQPGYVFRDFCLKQGIEFIIFVLIRVSIYQFCLKQDVFSWAINSRIFTSAC